MTLIANSPNTSNAIAKRPDQRSIIWSKGQGIGNGKARVFMHYPLTAVKLQQPITLATSRYLLNPWRNRINIKQLIIRNPGRPDTPVQSLSIVGGNAVCRRYPNSTVHRDDNIFDQICWRIHRWKANQMQMSSILSRPS